MQSSDTIDDAARTVSCLPLPPRCTHLQVMRRHLRRSRDHGSHLQAWQSTLAEKTMKQPLSGSGTTCKSTGMGHQQISISVQQAAQGALSGSSGQARPPIMKEVLATPEARPAFSGATSLMAVRGTRVEGKADTDWLLEGHMPGRTSMKRLPSSAAPGEPQEADRDERHADRRWDAVAVAVRDLR